MVPEETAPPFTRVGLGALTAQETGLCEQAKCAVALVARRVLVPTVRTARVRYVPVLLHKAPLLATYVCPARTGP
jgi:hypothetical protein